MFAKWRLRGEDPLNTYWNAVNRNAPAAELRRLAQQVSPEDIATIDEARRGFVNPVPDAQFVRRLEQTLMNIAATGGTNIVSLPINPRPERATEPIRFPFPYPGRRFNRRLWPAVAIIAVAAIVLGLLGGIWLLSQNETPNQVIPAATPTPNVLPDVPMYRGNPARTGQMPGPAVEGKPRVLWTYANNDFIESSAALVDGVLYFGGGVPGVIALDAADGTERWSTSFDAAVYTSPAVADGLVFAVTDDGVLVALDAATGEVRWSREGARPGANPLVDAGVLYIDQEGGTLSALDVATGDERWSATLPDEITRSPALADGQIFVTAAGQLHALNADDGALLWSWTSGKSQALAWEPAVSNGIVFLGSGGPESDPGDGFSAAIDASTGETIWLNEGAGYSRPATTGTSVFYVTDSGNISALDRESGEQVWTNDAGAEAWKGPVIAENQLYVGTRGGVLLALDATTGELSWSMELDSGIEFPPTISGGIAFVGTGFGSFTAVGGDSTALDAPSFEPPAPSASPAATSFDPEAMSLVWGTGDGLGTSTYGLAVSPLNGNIYVISTNRATISVYTPEGSLIEAWGGPGRETGQFRFIQEGEIASIDFDSDGNIYVFDAYNQRVQKFTPDHEFILAWGSVGTGDDQFGAVSGTVDRVHGLVYTIDNVQSLIRVFDLDGNFVRKWGSFGADPGEVVSPFAIAVAPDGTVYLADEGTRRIQHFTPDGELIAVLHEFEGREAYSAALAFDALGNLWAPSWNGNAFFIFSPDAQLIATVSQLPGVGQLLSPENIVFDLNGNLIFIMDGTGKGQLFAVNVDGAIEG